MTPFIFTSSVLLAIGAAAVAFWASRIARDTHKLNTNHFPHMIEETREMREEFQQKVAELEAKRESQSYLTGLPRYSRKLGRFV